MLKKLFALVFLFGAMVLLHKPYLSLPFHWDELGQFIPAALDLYRDGAWVTHSTLPNVHPPAVMALLAVVWRVFGYSIPASRLAMLATGSCGLLFSYLLAVRLTGGKGRAMVATAFLFASPLFYMQSIMTLLDMPAMTLTVLALLLFLEGRWLWSAIACVLLVLTKETALTTLAVFAAWLWFRTRQRREALYFAAPAVALGAWLIVLHHVSGYWLGNPGFGQYNIFDALHPRQILYSIGERLHLLFISDGHFIGVIAIYFGWRLLRGRDWEIAGWVAAAQILLVTLLGGAVLDRYVLPVLPILYAAFTTAAGAYSMKWRWASHAALLALLIAGSFWNPPYPFQYEHNLAMVDFIDLQKDAARYLENTAGDRRIASVWPFTGAIEIPEFGYVHRRLHAVKMESFDLSSVASLDRASFDYLVVYSRQYPMDEHWLNVAPLNPFIRNQTGYHPQATRGELAARGFRPVARWEQRGQWIEIYTP